MPTLRSLFLSFMDKTSTHFVWFDNYKFLFTDRSMLVSIRNTLIWLVCGTGFSVLIGLVVVDYMLFSRFGDLKKTLIKKHENELITIITYFEVYIRNKNNVYQSFNLLIPYCSSWMKDKVETLLKEIDSDKSVQPFVNFANNFSQLSSHSLLLSIYQMVDQGENSTQLEQFDIIFDELARNRHKEMMEQKEKSLGNMSTFPLIGAGAITVTLTISIISVLGDLMNVI